MTNPDKTKTDKSTASAKRAIADRWDRDKVRFDKKTSELKRGLDSDVDDFRQSFDDWMGTRSPLIDVTDKGNQYVSTWSCPALTRTTSTLS